MKRLEGFKPGHSLHMKFGVVIFISLVLAFIFGTQFSPLAPLGHRRHGHDHLPVQADPQGWAAAALRAARRAGLRHSSTRVRREGEEKQDELPSKETPSTTGSRMPPAMSTTAEWMKEVRIPSPAELGLPAEPAGEKTSDDLPKRRPSGRAGRSTAGIYFHGTH